MLTHTGLTYFGSVDKKEINNTPKSGDGREVVMELSWRPEASGRVPRDIQSLLLSNAHTHTHTHTYTHHPPTPDTLVMNGSASPGLSLTMAHLGTRLSGGESLFSLPQGHLCVSVATGSARVSDV